MTYNDESNDFRIGILSFNHPELTQRVIDSCLKLVEAPRITLLHNGSEPRWIKRLQELFPALDHQVLDQNRGFTGGTNHLLSYIFGKSPWCLFLTNDVQLLQLAIPTHSGMHGPLIHRRKHGVVDSLGGLFHPREGKLQHCRHEHHFNSPPSGWRRYIPGTAFWIDKTTFTKGGFFDETLGTYWEDVDYSQRLIDNNIYLGVDSRTELIHSVGKTCHKKKYYTSYLFVRNKYYVSLKYNANFPARALFKAHFWSQFWLGLLMDLKRRDPEGLRLKRQILRDLMRHRALPYQG